MFSVLLSLYIKEQPSHLKQCLDSLFGQSLLPDEIILVEDGPLTPELDAVVLGYADRHAILKVVPLPQNMGLGRALDEGLKHCSYELVARMDTDDIAKPERFQNQVEMFAKYPGIDVCGSWVDEFEGDASHIVSVRKLPERHEDIRSYAKSRSPLNHPAVMFKKSAVAAAGGYLHFPLHEDYYLWVRMLMNGAEFYNIQESLLYFRLSPATFKRRGGLKYAKYELRFQKLLLEKGFISWLVCIKNVAVRFLVCIMPNSLRSFVYKKWLRCDG